jgi:A/G-specific adenine glycosylase
MDKDTQKSSFLIEQLKKEYFIKKIREWGKTNFINYPWRKDRNIYRLLLTEIFLQKTDSLKIKNIYPFFEQIEKPADLLENEAVIDYIVSKIGLSYKKERVLQLSRQILNDFNGSVPDNYKDLRRLMGVGDYIANAVLTFGFKKKAAVVDTNTIRITESFFGYRSDKKRAREDRRINEIILSILPPRKYSLFNYYLLDFGALVCVSNKKFCSECILKQKCSYFIIKSNEIHRD